jgi:hypothetical protein
VTKLEKVILGLKCHKAGFYEECLKCPFHDDGRETTLCNDAIALLRDQEPRVMTFEEIKDNMGVPVCVEYADNENWNGYGVPTSDHKAYIMIYGANAYCANYAHTHNTAWRAWSAKPSEQQMKETPWEETDNG